MNRSATGSREDGLAIRPTGATLLEAGTVFNVNLEGPNLP